MPAKISFTQAEQAAIAGVLANGLHDSYMTPLSSLLKKMVAARTKESTKFSGVSVAKVHELARAKFGDRYKTPTIVTSQWVIKMQKAINDAGVTEATAAKAIENCNWQGDVFAQKLIYQLAELAVVAPGNNNRQQKLFGPPAPSKKSGWLNRMESEDE